MDHHTDLVFFEAHDIGRVLVENDIDNLHFEEVIARAECATLIRPALLGVVGDLCRVGAVEPPLRLGEIDIALRREASPHEVA